MGLLDTSNVVTGIIGSLCGIVTAGATIILWIYKKGRDDAERDQKISNASAAAGSALVTAEAARKSIADLEREVTAQLAEMTELLNSKIGELYTSLHSMETALSGRMSTTGDMLRDGVNGARQQIELVKQGMQYIAETVKQTEESVSKLLNSRAQSDVRIEAFETFRRDMESQIRDLSRQTATLDAVVKTRPQR